MSVSKNGFTVTGPGIDRGGYPSGPVGLSAAINLAQGIPEGDAVYVRDAAGNPYGRVECVSARGELLVYGKERV